MIFTRKYTGINTLVRMALGVVMPIFAAPVFAANGDYLDLDIEQLLQVPVTGATLRDESVKTVPAAVTLFTHDQLERLGMDYLYELVGLVTSYQFDRGADNAVNYTMSARGRRNGSQAREVLIVMDGRILTNPRTGSADISLPFIPLEQIERIEVIRGPGSAIYGSSAFSGVINIISRSEKNSAKVELGSDSRRSASLMLAQSIGDWSANLYARAYSDAGQAFAVTDTFSHLPTTIHDPRDTIDLDVGLKHEETQVRFGYHRTASDDFYMLENTRNGFNSFSVWLQQISVEQGLHIVEGVNTKVFLGYLANEQHLHVPVLGPGALANISQPPSNDPLLSKGTLAGESYNIRVTNDWAPTENSNALVGFEWKKENESEASIKNNFDLGQLAQQQRPINYYGDFSHGTPLGRMNAYQSTGVFGQYQYNLSERTGLTLGTRYDNYNDFGDHVSPRLGVVHQLTKNQTLKLLYGEAYRAPSLAETGVINNPILLGNPNLKYEVVKTWDLIWMGNWNNTAMSFSGFSNHYEHPIVAGFIGSARTFVNGNEETSDGLACAIRQSITPHWSMRATFTDFLSLPASAFREADKLASAEINFNQGAWNWNLLGYFQNERATLGVGNIKHSLDEFWIINSKLRYKFAGDYTLSLQVKNLTDLKYSTPAQGTNLPEGVVNRGRESSLVFEFPL